jgi:hypothetical protein
MIDQANNGRANGARIGLARLAAGLLAGVFLFVVFDLLEDKTPQFGMTPESWRQILSGLRTMAFFTPLPLVFGLGALPAIRLSFWFAIAAAGLFYVGWYAPAPVWTYYSPLVPIWGFSLLVVFIVHEFLQGARDDNKVIARFATYFDNAWRHGFQAVLALIFLGAFWVIIWLGVEMFNLIGIEAFSELIRTPEFSWIASASVLALGIHWTDEGSVLTRGARQIGLFLLSWLGILLTLIVTAFLVALPFTGLESLWDTKRATVLLLNIAAGMILLLNAAYQAGDPPTAPLVRRVVRFSAAPLLAIVALAFLGLWLRVNQYGFTPARVLASAELAIVSFYALGYAAAALRPFFIDEPWLAFVKTVNIAGAAFTVIILIGLMTPVLEPARVSVANQIARLNSGRVEPDNFDFGFLTDARAGGYGAEALAKLAERSGSERDERIAILAKNPGEAQQYRRIEQTFNDRRDALRFIDGAAAPDAALLPPNRGADPIVTCVAEKARFDEEVKLRAERERRAARLGRTLDDEEDKLQGDGRCIARRIDLNFDGVADILILSKRISYSRSRFSDVVISGLLLGADGAVQERVSSDFRSVKDSVVINDTNRDRHMHFEEEFVPAFAAARVTSARFFDLLIDGHRVRVTPITRELSHEAAAAAIVSLDGVTPPDDIFTTYDRPAWFGDNCLSEYIGQPSCFGKLMPVLTATDAPGAYVVTNLNALTGEIRIRIWADEDGAWRAIGQGELNTDYGSSRLPTVEAAESEDETKEMTAEIRRLLTEEMEVIPSIVGDLEIDGVRRTFRYEPRTQSPE